MKVLENLLYSKDHEWVKVDGDKAYIGITDYAQDALGDIVYVELPSIDDELSKDETFGTIESVKAASDAFSPISGTVIEVNESLEDTPDALNEDPYENWVVCVNVGDKSELEELMSAEDYKKFVSEEA
ncbi:glycine cleavage system protein GcvH [Hathewaya histolytica]|uniref:Glycine cleavage system H protein n=1 Tax=Hathewaya histolytica TaxID=1498 RepID=A0A4U9RTM2_HATHI|nr:glycine cleavage system protein GcvH [Hathewaya histolytica]VTQ95675.1 glycine cleavage system H protein [Hathewaya histolytica]